MFFRRQAEIVQNFPGSTLASVAELFSQLGLGVAEAQAALDDNSVRQTLILAGVLNPDGTVPASGTSPQVPKVGDKTLLELGFVPSFYYFESVDISVSMFVSMTYKRDESFNFGIGYSQGKYEGTDVNASNTGSVTITVVQGEARHAKAKVVVKKNRQGAYVAVDGDKIEVVQTGSGALHVPVSPPGLYQVSQRIADKLRSEDMPKIGRVETKVTSRGITELDTNEPTHFVLHEANGTIELSGSNPSPARAWFSLSDNGAVPGALNLKLDGQTAASYSVDTTGADVTVGSDVADTANLLAAHVGGQALWNAAQTKAIFSAGTFLHTFLFKYDKSDAGDPPTEDSTPSERNTRLDLLADFLKATGVSVDLVGHTDDSGRASYNIGLGTRRAAAIQLALTSRGVNGGQLEVKSKGETELLSGHPSDSVYQRRVEVILKGAQAGTSVIQVEAATPVSAWDDTATNISGLGGHRLGLKDGAAASPIVANDWVSIRSANQTTETKYTAVTGTPTGEQFAIDADVTKTAENLAEIINDTNAGGVSAYAQGAIVYLLGPGSEVELTMYAKTPGKQGNDLSLAADGDAIVVPNGEGFSGGADAGTPNPKSASNPTGDTVSLGENVFTLVSSSPTGTEFALGDSAPKTAKNLADKINAIAGFSASVPAGNADTIQVTGPTGTSVATSNATAFKLSSPRIGGYLANAELKKGNWQAFAVTADYHFSQKFDVTASGNATVSGKLKSVPPPAQFIQSLEDWTDLLDG